MLHNPQFYYFQIAHFYDSVLWFHSLTDFVLIYAQTVLLNPDLEL